MGTSIVHKIPIVGDFLRYFTITRAYIGAELGLFIALNLVSAIIESIGILLFIPFLSQLTGPSTAPSDRITGLLSSWLAAWNIRATIGHTLALLVLVFVLKGVMVFFLTVYRQMLLNRTGQKIREALIGLYSDLDYRYAMRKSTGFFGNLVVSETERALAGLEGFCHVLSSLITACIFFTLAFFLHGSLSVFMLMAVGFSFFLLRKLSARARRYSTQIASLSTRLNEFLIETLQAFKYLKATERFPRLREQFVKICAGTTQARNKLAWVNASVIAAQEPLLVIFLSGMFYYAVVITQQSVASVMVSVLFFYRCMIEMGHFNRHWQWVSSHAGSLELVWTAAREMADHREKKDGEAAGQFRERIELRQVSYAYDAHPVLQDVNIRIGKNTAVAFVGASGVGKTTLVDLLTGVLKPTRGAIYVDDRDLHALDLSRYRQSIGYVEQETVVFDDTIANNISMQWAASIDAETLARIQQAARGSYCDEFIERLPQGYHTQVGERGLKLSGGQRQRLAIARELFKQPDILILDEATSSLDSESEAYIQESIKRLRGTLTMMIISHRLSTIKHVDYVYVIDQGRIIEQGTFSELSGLTGSAFRRMCELQRVASP
jgi:subfamily B ATP-binding cassette protein MsbA